VELLTVEYLQQNISVINMMLHKKNNKTPLYICITPTNNMLLAKFYISN